MDALWPLGNAVRHARTEAGLTLRALAERSGVSLRFLSDLEAGRGNISVGRLVEVARALGVPVTDLVAPLDRPATSLALVGLRGAGKSTVGSRVAHELGVSFIELDTEIEAAAGLPLGQVFEIHGEAYYSRLEREVLTEVLSSNVPKVIATGGGIVNDPETWKMLKRGARTVWLKAHPEEHYERVMLQGDLRPMKNRPSAMAELRTILEARAPLYAESDLTVETSSLGLQGSVAQVLGFVRGVTPVSPT